MRHFCPVKDWTYKVFGFVSDVQFIKVKIAVKSAPNRFYKKYVKPN